MTQILSWNIQNGMGVDGKVSLARIAGIIGDMGSHDVICLQEVSRGLKLGDGGGHPDQVAELETLFPGYAVVFGAAIDALSQPAGNRWQFGNVILSRLPLLSIQHHLLARPADGGVKHMTRQATEVVVDTGGGAIRVVNLHLEYHSLVQRNAQIDQLRNIQMAACAELAAPPKAEPDGAYQRIPRPVDSVYCGDFNMLVDAEEYQLMLSPMTENCASFRDAWRIAHPDAPHAPTCGIFDREMWREGPHCRDFFFVSGACADMVAELNVNVTTDASDHQPISLSLDITKRDQ